MPATPHLVELGEAQLRQLVDAQATWRAWQSARAEAGQVRGTMFWREAAGRSYLIRQTGRQQKSLGPRDSRTEAMLEGFQRRKRPAEERLKSMKARLDEQRRLNRVYRVGRAPAVVVRTLAALDEAGIADKFIVIGTHALYAYEAAAGVLVSSGALATQDLDLLFDARKRLAFLTTLERSGLRTLIGVLKKADPTFRIRRDQLHTAVNDAGFEVDVVRRIAADGDPHPMPMSDSEDDFWAVQIDQGERLASARPFEQLVVASTGEMAMMRTVHPLDFVRLKLELAARKARDPLKAPKDRLQAEVVLAMWEGYLRGTVQE
jgi:hypothetical protein